MEKHSYHLDLKWSKDRIGTISSPDLPIKIEVATPPEFDKGVAGIWSPEHLFTGSVLSCFMTTFLAIAEYSQFEFESFDCSAEGVLEKIEGKYLMTEIHLKPILKIKDDSKKDKAERLLQKAEAACLISNSIKTQVHLICNILV
ncbi:MAG: OsmC family protein [Flavobacteriia bacterium]|nr:OsmC family protein [Flavobacteriia bacterium]